MTHACHAASMHEAQKSEVVLHISSGLKWLDVHVCTQSEVNRLRKTLNFLLREHHKQALAMAMHALSVHSYKD